MNPPLDHVVRAEPADAEQLSELVATSFYALAPSEWLIPDEAARVEVFAPYFRIYVDDALANGTVYTNRDRTAVALWVSQGLTPAAAAHGHAADHGGEYDSRLAAVTGPWVDRFRDFDAMLDKHHPTGMRHDHLAILAVHPDRQRSGIGSALLAHHHQILDQAQIPAYLEASDAGTRSMYLRFGYEDHGSPIHLSENGPLMYPMWRVPAERSLTELG